MVRSQGGAKLPGLLKRYRYSVEWTNSQGVKKKDYFYLKRTAESYAKLLERAHGFKAVIREL